MLLFFELFLSFLIAAILFCGTVLCIIHRTEINQFFRELKAKRENG